MGFEFKGFFTKNEQAALAALDEWPFCKMKAVNSQIVGYAVKIPVEGELDPHSDWQAYEEVLEQAYAVEEGLLAFSIRFPEDVFVYMHLDCFGGACEQTARHIQRGELLREIVNTPREASKLKEMLAPLGARLDQGNVFDPFKRGFFKDC